MVDKDYGVNSANINPSLSTYSSVDYTSINDPHEDNYDTEISIHVARQSSTTPTKPLHELLGDAQSPLLSKHTKHTIKKVPQKSDTIMRRLLSTLNY